MYKTLATLSNDVAAEHERNHYYDLWRVDISPVAGDIKVISSGKKVNCDHMKMPRGRHAIIVCGYGSDNELVIKPLKTGKITIALSGVDRLTADGSRQKVLSHFKSVMVDGKECLKEKTVTWFGDKKSIEINGEAGHRIELKIDAFTNEELKLIRKHGKRSDKR